jgi:hypothetical protein
MATKTKRTYNLDPATVERVREIAHRADIAASQDRVVDIAVERLYDELRAREEEVLWAEARLDAEFRTEMRQLANVYRDTESWPE